MKTKRILASFIAMAMTMGMMSSLVLADESENAPEETSVVETTEPKEKEAKEPEKNKPSESSKEADSSESEDKKPAETTAPAESKKEEPSEPDETEPEQSSKPIEEDEPSTTVAPEERGKEDSHSVPPKNEQASTVTISTVSITIDAPQIGEKPDYTAEFPSGANYYSEAFSNEYYDNYIRWLDVTNNTFMYKDSAKFEGKHEYQVVLFLTAKEGYSFSNSTTAKVNGNSAIISIDEAGHLRVSYNFPLLKEQITSVSVDLDAPVVGATPDYTAVFPSGSNYYSKKHNDVTFHNDINWYDVTAKSAVFPDSGVFRAGHQYRVKVYLTAKSEYYFSGNTTATLNGKTATADVVSSQLMVEYTFPALEGEATDIISSVSVTLNAPVAGAKPEYTAVLPSGANCYVETQATGTYVRNGIKWRDMSTSTDLDPDSDEFAVGHLYEVSFYLSAKDDYTIPNNITVQINGQTASASLYFDHLLVRYTFPALTSVNTLSVTPKTAKVKYKKLKKKKQTVARSKVMNVQYAQGKVTYKLTGVKRGKSKKYKKYFKINATTGKVTIKKRLKKGTYKVTCVVTAAGDSNYKAGTKTVTFTIKVK